MAKISCDVETDLKICVWSQSIIFAIKL